MASHLDKPVHTIREWPRLADEVRYEDVRSREDGTAELHASITRRLEPWEQALIASAQEHVVEQSSRVRSMNEASDALLALHKAALNGEDVSAEEWARADGLAAELIERSQRSRPAAEKLIEDLSDPLEALARLEDRYASLRRPPFSS